MNLLHRFVKQGGTVIELDPQRKGRVKGPRIHHVRSFDEARRLMLTDGDGAPTP